MKERYRKQKFLKNLSLFPNKTQRPVNADEDNDINICERVCFYYFDDDAQVICRGCYKSFKTWLNFRMHFNTLSCHITETNYKLKSYNDVYKKYKLRKAKTKKKIVRLNAGQLMDLETLNIRKTRKRCYQNTRVVVTVSKSSSDSSSLNSEKTAVKTSKKEAVENCITSNDSLEESKTKPIGGDTVQVPDIPSSAKTIIPNSPPKNQTTLTIKTEWNADDLSQVSSDDLSSSSANCPPKYSPQKDKALKYQYVCVICDAQFMSKCSLTMHQVQHIKSDRSSYSVFMAALTQSARV